MIIIVGVDDCHFSPVPVGSLAIIGPLFFSYISQPITYRVENGTISGWHRHSMALNCNYQLVLLVVRNYVALYQSPHSAIHRIHCYFSDQRRVPSNFLMGENIR